MTVYPHLIEEGLADECSLVRVTRDAQRAVATLSDPDRLNPLSAGLVLRLRSHLSKLAADRELRAIVLTGGGNPFCAGGDLEMIATGATAIQDASELGPSARATAT
jgi:enoyl-CoA hydratase